MAGRDSFAAVDQEHPKSSRSLRWRGRIFKERDKAEPTEKQLDDFFGENRAAKINPNNVPPQPAPVAATAPPVQLPAPPAPPRIDVDMLQARKEANTLSPISPVSTNLHPSQSPPRSRHDHHPPRRNVNGFRKPPRRPGLRVAFSEEEPEIIGEGGDESEEPTMEISFNRRSPSTVKYHTLHHEPDRVDIDDRQPTLPNLDFDSTMGADNAQSKPEAPRLLINSQDSDFLTALSAETKGSRRLSFRASPDSNSMAKQVQARMQEEEALALQQRLDSPSFASKDENNTGAESHGEDLAFRPGQRSLQPSAEQSNSPPPSISLRASPSPAVYEPARYSGLSPTGLSAGGSSHSLVSLSDSRLGPPGSLSQYRPASRESSHDPAPPPPAHQASPKLSLRSVASAVGDTAYAEFKTHASRYTAAFRNAAEGARSLPETPFADWVRAAAWWFLKGRNSLETAVRAARSSDPNAHGPSKASPGQLEQAVVDLAKAWWICDQVLPQHPTLTRYGKLGPDAMLAVMNTTGDFRNAGLLNMQQKIMHHVKALAMSMKRNNVFADIAATANMPGLRIDTGIWLWYPPLAPDVAAILSGAALNSMHPNAATADTVPNSETPDMMLISDTSQFFSYGNMFVHAYVNAGSDAPTPPQPIPCVLSIMRNKAAWYVQVAIASQVEVINVKIQADRKHGPTWDEVKWDVQSCSMRVKLQRGVVLDVLFSEKDFRMIWNIVQYTRKTQSGLQPEDGETLVFENVLKVFQYMDPSPSKAFPTDPVPQCHVRLFEKSKVVTEGTGSRKAHRGYRLAVVSSSQVKTLSAVYHSVGEDAPIVFGLLRGEGGAPALLLHVTEQARTTSMVMTFNHLDERTMMHSLLLGVLARDQEVQIPQIPLRSFTIEQPPDVDSPLPGITHIQFSSGNVSVIDKPQAPNEHGHPPAILSENLRALIASDWGTVTDRINLSMYLHPVRLRLQLC